MLTAVRCLYCGRRSPAAVCVGCKTRRRPTMLRTWLASSGVSGVELARRVGCSWRTVHRAADGWPVSGPVAVGLQRETGIPVRILVRGTNDSPRKPGGAGGGVRSVAHVAARQHGAGAGGAGDVAGDGGSHGAPSPCADDGV